MARSEQRPFVLLNLAMTADGKIATADRSITTFGSPRDLAHLYELRATADAILCGARTVEETGATLGNGPDPRGAVRRRRVARGLREFPLRVVVSGSGSLSPAAKIWSTHDAPLIVLTSVRAPVRSRDALTRLGAEVWTSPGRQIEFETVLQRLLREHGVKRLLCEGGGQLNAALLQADLIDELNLTLCPLLFGGRTAPSVFDGEGFATLSDATRWAVASERRIGNEMFLVYRRVRVVGKLKV